MVRLTQHQCSSVLTSHIHAIPGINLLVKLLVNVTLPVIQQLVPSLDRDQNVKVSNLRQLKKKLYFTELFSLSRRCQTATLKVLDQKIDHLKLAL